MLAGPECLFESRADLGTTKVWHHRVDVLSLEECQSRDADKVKVTHGKS